MKDDLSIKELKEITERLARIDERVSANEKFVMLNLASQKEAVQAAMAASEKAISRADTAIEKRLESVNEFRGQQKDLIATLVTRNEYNQGHTALEEKVSDVASRLDKIQGTEKGIGIGWAVFLGTIAVLSSLVSIAAVLFSFLRR